MTKEEAIDCLKNEKLCILIADKNECTRECSKCGLIMETDTLLTAYDIAIKALGKQTPKKPIKSDREIRYCEVWKCPKCGFEWSSRVVDYCYKCGQAIDWSEEE